MHRPTRSPVARRAFTAFAAMGLASLLAPSADATQLQTTATPFTGDPLEVTLTADDELAPDVLTVTLSISGPGSTTGDIRGFFLNVEDDFLLPDLTVTGPDVTSVSVLANGVDSAGPGNDLNGGGTPCPCDLGVEFGTPGIGSDDLQNVTFTISHASRAIDVFFVAEQSFGVRVTSVGDGGMREGSSKLSGVVPVVPEPGAGLLMGLGMLALGMSRPRSA